MLDHVIMFRADDLSAEEEVELLGQLARLRHVPGVLGFASGKNVGSCSRGFDYCVRITFKDMAAQDAYQAHPLHVEIAEYNRRVTSEFICVDFNWNHLELC